MKYLNYFNKYRMNESVSLNDLVNAISSVCPKDETNLEPDEVFNMMRDKMQELLGSEDYTLEVNDVQGQNSYTEGEVVGFNFMDSMKRGTEGSFYYFEFKHNLIDDYSGTFCIVYGESVSKPPKTEVIIVEWYENKDKYCYDLDEESLITVLGIINRNIS